MVSYIYEPAVSPHLAAELEKRPVDMNKIQSDFHHTAAQFDVVVAEGSGGIICPLRMDSSPIMLTDVIQTLHLPILIVAHAGLGSHQQYCFNRSICQTAQYYCQRNYIKSIRF